jgi:uncharacterized protein YukE
MERDELIKVGETVAATSTVGAGLLWVFREKVSTWVKRQTRGQLEGLGKRTDSLEARMDGVEHRHDMVEQSFAKAATALAEGMARLTTQVERIAESHEQTRETVGYIRGRLDQADGVSMLEQRDDTAKRRRREDR